MKRILSLLLLLSVVGIAVADIPAERRLIKPPVNRDMLASEQPRILDQAIRIIRHYSFPWWPVELRFSAPRQVDPVPPVCDMYCYLQPIQAIAE